MRSVAEAAIREMRFSYQGCYFGAGSADAQLASLLRLAGSQSIVAFLDDAPHLWHRLIYGITIHPPEQLCDLLGE